MSNTTKQLLPSQIGCIDMEWLEEEIKYSELFEAPFGSGYINALKSIQSKLFPIEPILKDAFGSGYGCGFNDSDFEERKQTYFTQPITIKLEDNGNE